MPVEEHIRIDILQMAIAQAKGARSICPVATLTS